MARRNARDVVVRFLSDVNGFLRGTDDVADAYRDVARDADRTADAGEDSARRLSRAYERAADKIERDARESARDTRKAYGDTGKEAGTEFTQNLGEAVSSGDLTGVVSGTLGGLAAQFGTAGPLGIAFAGIATAGAFAFTQIQAAAEKAAEAAANAFEDLLSSADKEARLRGRLTDAYGEYGKGLDTLGRVADQTGIEVADLGDAFIGSEDSARAMADNLKRIADNSPRGMTDGINETLLRQVAEDLERAATATETAARWEERRADALLLSSQRVSAAYYGTNNLAGLPAYATGKR